MKFTACLTSHPAEGFRTFGSTALMEQEKQLKCGGAQSSQWVYRRNRPHRSLPPVETKLAFRVVLFWDAAQARQFSWFLSSEKSSGRSHMRAAGCLTPVAK